MTISYLPITVVHKEMFQENEKILLYISHSLAQHFGIISGDFIHVCVGLQKVMMKVETKQIPKEELHFSKTLFEQWQLPLRPLHLLAQYKSEKKTLLMGPIIGMMTEVAEDKESGNPNFRSVHAFCEELDHAIRSFGGLFYVFHIKDFTSNGVTAYFLDEDSWIKRKVPLPNVIYNRIHSRQFEASPFFQKVMNHMESIAIPVFNNQFLSKWTVHEKLVGEEHMHPYLPETVLFTDENLYRMLENYHSVYIKPYMGSQGKDIVRLTSINNFYCAETSFGKTAVDPLLFDSIPQFSKWFRPKQKKTTYLIQQSIPLLKYHNRQLDFRVLVHKNYQDVWRITSIVARVSAEKQFVSNIARGGEIMKPLHLLSTLFDRKTAIQQMAIIKEIAMETANIIGTNSKGLIGELGVDIGVDHNGKPWIIEVNSKPSKNFEEQDHNIRPSAKAIIEYCTALAFKQMNLKEE